MNALTREHGIVSAWKRGLLTYKLHAGQHVVNNKLNELPPNARQIVFLCGRRWGKSFFALFLAIVACLKKPGARILLLAPYANQASEITGPLMSKLTADAPAGLIKRHRSTNRWNFFNGSVLMISGMDLIADTKRGLEFDDIFLEESGSSGPGNFMYTIQHVLFPMLLASRGRIFHVTTLPREEDHPFITEVMPKCDAMGSLFTFPTTECPLYTKEQLDEMCAEVGGPESVAWLREFMCISVRDGTLVAIPEFDVATVVKAFELPPHYKFWIGGDWGGVRDKTAFLFFAYDFRRAKILIVDEAVFENHTPTSLVVKGVKEDLEGKWGLVKAPRYVDCPGQLQIDLARPEPEGHGFPVAMPQKDGFEESLNLVRTMVKSVEIHPRCVKLIATMKYARLNKQRTDFERTPAHGHADALMALCYGLRYVNRANPFPILGGRDPMTLHIPANVVNNLSPDAAVIKSLFTVR